MAEKGVRLQGIRRRLLQRPPNRFTSGTSRWQPQDCPRPLRPGCSSDPIRGLAPAERRHPARARTTQAGRARGCAVAQFRSLRVLHRLRVGLRTGSGPERDDAAGLGASAQHFACCSSSACLIQRSSTHLTPRGQEVVRPQADRLRRSAELWAFVLGKACRPLPKLLNLLVVNQEDPSAAARQPRALPLDPNRHELASKRGGRTLVRPDERFLATAGRS